MAGYSLVEILVALVVLLFISAFLFPVIGTLRKRGLQVKCLSNMRGYFTALCAYQADHNGFYPPGKRVIYNKDLATIASETSIRSINVASLLKPNYIGEETPLYCPATKLNKDGLKDYPDEKKRLRQLVTYAIHAYLLQTKPTELPGPRWPKAIPYPGNHKMFVLAESSGPEAMHVPSHLDFALYGYPGVKIRNTLARNHVYPDGLNFIFLDGHAQTLRRGSLEEGEPDTWWSENGELDRWGEKGRFIGPTYVDETREY